MRVNRETQEKEVSPVIHLERARDPQTTVCGVSICAECERVEIAVLDARKTRWCPRCLGAFKVK